MSVAPLRVFLADDNELNRELIGLQLESFGLQVDSVAEGEAALRHLLSERYDLVLLDLRMPGLSGCEVVGRLRKQPGPNRDAPMVALTAQALNAERNALLAEGFDEVLYKPLEMDGLVGTVRRLCPGPRGDADTPIANPWHCLLERTNGSASLALLLLERLFEELPRQMRQIADALSAGQRTAALETTHKLHGSAAYCGLPAIKAAADSLERLLLGQGQDDELEAQGRLQAAIDEFLAQKDALLAEAASLVSGAGSPANSLHPVS